MKKKILFLLLIVALGTMTVSCFKKKEKDKEKPTTEQQINNTNGSINTDMFNAGNQPLGDPNIKNITPEEQQFLINNQIDPLKVSSAIDKAQQGDKEAILSLAQLYFNLKDNEKTKKYLQMGVDKNYPEAIYNMAVLLKEEGNEAEANKLMARLPKNAATTSRQLKPGAQAYNNGIDLIKAKKYNEAKIQFQNAYNQGLKEADIQIALLNKETKNYNEAVKWFKIALGRGVTAANFEIGAILYDTGRESEARPYLMKAYNSGNKAMAMPIALSYHKENNMKEALKWYKIAAKNGDKSAKETVAQIEGGNTKNSSKVNSILGDSSQRSLTDSTISNLKNNNSKGTNDTIFNPNIAKNEQTSVPNYNVNLDRPKNSGNSSNSAKQNTVTTTLGKVDNKSAKPSTSQTQQQKIDEKEQRRTEKAVADAIRRASKRKDSKSKDTDNVNATPSDKNIEDVINKKAAEYK